MPEWLSHARLWLTFVWSVAPGGERGGASSLGLRGDITARIASAAAGVTVVAGVSY
jgi:hypothetical protein